MKNLAKKYAGEWVSISRDFKKVFAHSPKAEVLNKKAIRMDPDKAIIIRVPAKVPLTYVG